jgi:hypothetical protein
MSAPMVVPMGRYLGLLGAADGGLHHTVRLGGRRLALSNDDMLVWALAHGSAGATGTGPWDRSALRRAAPPEADLDGAVDRLVAAGLLAEVGRPAAEFARTVRLLPLAVGLGNTPARPRSFAVGFPGITLATLTPGVFYLWSWAGAEPDLWSACRAAAGDDGAHHLLADLLDGLHALLSTNAACLDTAIA